MIKLKFICENILCAIYSVEYNLSDNEWIHKELNICPHCKIKMQRVL